MIERLDLCSHAGECIDNLREHDGAFCANSLLPELLRLTEIESLLDAISAQGGKITVTFPAGKPHV